MSTIHTTSPQPDPTPAELEKAERAHAQCREAWASLSPAALRGTTMHGVDAHLAVATARSR